MAKVRKKNSIHKRKQKLSDHLLKNILIVYCDRIEGCYLYNRKGEYILKATEAQVGACEMPHNWSCYIAAFGRNQFDEYMKSNIIHTGARYRQSDLSQIFEDHHIDLMKTIPENQLCGVGWIADPFGGDVSEKEAGNIFTKLEAWG